LEKWQTSYMNLKGLAAYLNLSQTTVSRALNGYPEVSEETRNRVREAARLHNYRPNPNAMRLATGRSHAIGHILPTDRTLMMDPHFSEFISGAGEVFGIRGFDLVMSMASPESEASVYRRFKHSSTVEGFVVHGPQIDDWRLSLLTDLGLPFIVHGRFGSTEEGYAWLDIDNRGAFEQATRLLADLGHRRIALINGLEVMTFAAHRRQGYEAALRSRGLTPDPAIMSSDQMTEENGYIRMRSFLESTCRPTAAICSSMLSASGAIRAIQEDGLKVGADISLIAHDDGMPFLKAEGLSPPLTTTRSPIRDAGCRIADLLLGLIENPGSELPRELWKPDLVVRGSTGPAPAIAA
jgi:LacI family transcriptional regulator